jgi:hypothetical protein
LGGTAVVPANDYHSKTAQFAAKARIELNPILRQKYEELTSMYLRLAVHTDPAREDDAVYMPLNETPQPVQPQQQRGQPDKKKDGE